MTGEIPLVHRLVNFAVLVAGANAVQRAVQHNVMFAQCGDIVQRQITGGVIAAVAHLIVIDTEVIVQGTAYFVDAGLADIFAARAQHGTQRRFFHHQLQQQLTQTKLQQGIFGQVDFEVFAEGFIGQRGQLFAGLLAHRGVIIIFLQLNLPHAQRTVIKPDKGVADPLIVLSTGATFKVDKQRDAHPVL
ncbi:hypothetical protein SB6408_03124 [Klebsiella spallanzanii]|uniref:Uncharacterized protein n=1 Tax=Klebsiella spallanzanii TaxID=2587528 RepID=A0A564P0M8_9ENTR|nr:hypothetical protein SB6408_03124 [Klebsiella spallanzanii]